MNEPMQDPVGQWTVKRTTALAFGIIQGKTTIPEASRAYDLTPSNIEGWIKDGKNAFGNTMRTKPLDVRQQHKKGFRELQKVCFDALLDAEEEK